MSRPLRALLVCPGRGSYDRESLGSLQHLVPGAVPLVDACDDWRTEHGRLTVRELDGAERLQSTLHIAGENASLLTFACTVADWQALNRERYDVVGVTGNSMGFYTALAVSGALPFADTVKLVDTMGSYQRQNVVGGQLVYPLSDDSWRPDPEREALVERALEQVRREGHWAGWSIRLGNVAVLGADRDGLAALEASLPSIQRGARTFPLRLPLHSAFHTPLMSESAGRADLELRDLAFQAPTVPLVDGRGALFRPWSTDPTALRDYTLHTQVVAPFDFTTAVRSALRHCVPDVVVALGPGNSLGAPLAAILVQEGWSGVRSREEFTARQALEPLLLSFGVPDQRERLR